MMNSDFSDVVRELSDELRKRGLTMCTAESCTGGAIATAITSFPGSSLIFKGGVVVYSNEVKMSVLGVSCDTLDSHGAVSEPTVREMVVGVRRLMQSDCAIATSGIAGPGGGSPEKPVGTVWVAVAVGENVATQLLSLKDEGREKNICASVKKALSLLLKTIRAV